MFRAMIPVPGNGAVREPVFADGVHAAVMACMLVQLPESGHCTVRIPFPAPAISRAADGRRAWSSMRTAGDEP